MGKNIINSLLNLPVAEPETAKVKVPRLGITFTLKELSYDRIVKCRGERESTLHYLLASVTEPNLKDEAWYHGHLGCATPVDALKKLLRAGEIEALCRAADKLNGYGGGAVISVNSSEEALEGEALNMALEELEKN